MHDQDRRNQRNKLLHRLESDRHGVEAGFVDSCYYTEVRSVHVLPRNKFQKVVKIRQILHLLEVYLSDSVGVEYKTYTGGQNVSNWSQLFTAILAR